MTEYRLLYVPVASQQEGERLAHALLEEKLIACANLLPDMHSIYSWNGKVESSQESLLLMKTQKSLVSEARKKIEELHSYTCPCIAELTLESLNGEYADWLKGCLKSSGSK